MRFRSVVFAVLSCAALGVLAFGLTEAQAPALAPAHATAKGGTPAAAKSGVAAVTPKVYANLAQVMRGIFLTNSNIIFYAQSKNPADVKPAPDPSLSTDPLSSTYGGWAAVENSSLALAEASNLLIIPGRVCSNGRPAPLKNPDWAKFVQGLRDASMTAYKAAQAKDQDKVLDAADAVSTACQNCHDRYREKPGGVADRCM